MCIRDRCPEGDKRQWEELRTTLLTNLAQGYRSILELDKSTAVLARLSRETTDPRRLTMLAEAIELNRELKVYLASHRGNAPIREKVRSLMSQDCGSRTHYYSKGWKKTASIFDGSLTSYLRSRLTTDRETCRRFVMGRHRMFKLSSSTRGTSLSTGPQRERDAVDELRFYQDDSMPDKPDKAFLFVVDGVQKSELRARFLADYRPASDWGMGERAERKGISLSLIHI